MEEEMSSEEQFLIDVRAVVAHHWSGLPELRPDESVWARLDAVLFDDAGQERDMPDYEAKP
jgi:hypothetical protein